MEGMEGEKTRRGGEGNMGTKMEELKIQEIQQTSELIHSYLHVQCLLRLLWRRE